MANFDHALPYVLDNEGGLTNNPNDRGGLTKWGITKATAEEFGLTIATLTMAQAKAIYRAKYWRHESLASQRVATKSFDTAVNVGVVRGMQLLQRAANRTGVLPRLVEDGLVGPKTIAAINGIYERDMLEAMKDVQVIYYAEIINNNAKELDRLIRRTGYDVPNDFKQQAVFVLGWMRRAIELPT